MKQLDESSKSLTALISPRLGHSVPLGISPIQSSAPKIQPTKLDQIAALPLGARLKLDPYSDRVELLKAKPVALLSAREKMPFEVTPFMPYLTRYTAPDRRATATADNPRGNRASRHESDVVSGAFDARGRSACRRADYRDGFHGSGPAGDCASERTSER